MVQGRFAAASPDLFLRPENGCLGEGKNDQLLPGHGGDVVVDAHQRHADRIFHDLGQPLPAVCDHVRPHLLEQDPALAGVVTVARGHSVTTGGPIAVGRRGLRPGSDQLSLRRREHALQPHDQQRADEVGVDIPRATADEFLLESRDAVADGRLDLTLGFHDRAAAPFGEVAPLVEGLPFPFPLPFPLPLQILSQTSRR